MPTGDAYSSGHLVPSLWDLHMFYLLRPILFRTCRNFSGLCSSNIPRYFLDFSYYFNQKIIINVHPINHHYRNTHARHRYFDLFACLVTLEWFQRGYVHFFLFRSIWHLKTTLNINDYFSPSVTLKDVSIEKVTTKNFCWVYMARVMLRKLHCDVMKTRCHTANKFAGCLIGWWVYGFIFTAAAVYMARFTSRKRHIDVMKTHCFLTS